MKRWNRRGFVTSLLGAAASARSAAWASHRPISRVGGPAIRVSCNAYSFNALLTEGVMSVDDLLEFLAIHNFDAVDLTGYYLPNYPNLPPDQEIYRIKRRAFLLGLAISGTGVRNDFTSPDPERREADVQHVRQWVPVAAKLGAPVIRVFAGAGVPEGHSSEQVYSWVAEGLRRCAEFGSQYGVLIALQNHAGLLKSASEVLRLLEMVDSDWVGLNLDIGSFRTADPYSDIARLAPLAVTWQIKEEVYYGEKKVRTDLRKVVEIVREAGYRGYLPLEILGREEPGKRLAVFLEDFRQALRG